MLRTANYEEIRLQKPEELHESEFWTQLDREEILLHD